MMLFRTSVLFMAGLLCSTAQPRVEVTLQGTNVMLSWPWQTSTNFQLQHSAALGTNADWSILADPPSSNSGQWQVVLAASESTRFFRLFSTNAILDEPDDAFVDSDGDGIDGTAAAAVFVSTTGSDSAPGTMAEPVHSIPVAMAKALESGKRHVYVSEGLFVSSSSLMLAEGTSIYGGYSSSDWSRSEQNITSLAISTPTAIVVNNVTNSTALDHLAISGTDSTNSGGSAYGIFARNSPGLIVHKCKISSGNGSGGIAGTNGIAGLSGGNGFLGDPGCENGGTFCSKCGQPRGGIGGGSPCGMIGGNGGLAGLATLPGSSGSPGTGGTAGGFGTPAGKGNWNPPEQFWGLNGLPGTNGINGTAAGLGEFTMDGFLPSAGTNGLAGGPGFGGGGGGGGGGGSSNCDSYGGGGGGGGGGACGGTGGAGGGSGGGSFAIYLWASDVRIESSTLAPGNGGNGGAGGQGGDGGMGGTGAFIASVPGAGNPYGGSNQDDGSNGGQGGNGGNGGPGGYGGGGAGGPSIGIARAGSSNPQIQSATFVVGSGGAGGSSGGHPGPNGLAASVFQGD